MALQHLRSSTANKRPLPAGMSDGQLAVNTNSTSPGIFFKTSTGVLIKAGPVHVGTTAPNASPASGGETGNSTGELWLDTSLTPNELKTWDGTAWISATGQEIPVSKLIDGSARQLLQTDAAGTGVEWTSNVDVPGTLDVTSTATFDSIAQYPLGSAAAPTITFTGDNNTGIYSPGADQVALATGGTGRLFVDSSGRVGIGTSTPSTIFQCSDGASGTDTRITIGNAAAAIQTGIDGSNFAFIGTSQNQPLYFYTNGSERLRITSAGLVGIGTNNPSANLQVAAADAKIRIGLDASNQYTDIYRDNSTGFTIYNAAQASTFRGHIWQLGGTEAARIDSSGRVGIGTSSPNFRIHSGIDLGTQSPSVRQIGAVIGSSYTRSDNSQFVGRRIALGAIDYAACIQGEDNGGNATNLAINASGGNVGIGTTSPDSNSKLHVAGGRIVAQGSDQYAIQLQNGATIGGLIGAPGAGETAFYNTGGVERARIDSSGRLLVGTSSSVTTIADSPKVQVFVGDQGAASYIRGSANEFGPNVHLVKSRNTSSGSRTIVQSGDELGTLWFAGDDGSTLNSIGALIRCQVDGTPGANDMPGRLVFSTTADGASTPTERMRIANNGVITIQNGAVAVIGTLTDGATITPDFAADCNFTVTLGGARTIANPTNITAGQSGSIFIVQDATGGRTASWGSYWDFPGGTAPTLSTAANAVDRVDYIVRSSTSIHTVFTANYS